MRKLNVLFYRNYESVHGGHVVFRQLFDFLESHHMYDPFVFFSPKSNWDTNNLWFDRPERRISSWKPNEASLLVLGGIDWESIPKELASSGTTPIIHVVTAHYFAEPGHYSYEFLKYPAVRVALCPSIKDSLERANCTGPIYSWTEAIDFDPETFLGNKKNIDWLIIGYKNPELAASLVSRMRRDPLFDHQNIKVLNQIVSRKDYLSLLADAKSVLLLPYEVEGYFRAAIEAMALQTFVVTPDSKGPRDQCHDQLNCLFPAYQEDSIFSSICQAETMSESSKLTILENGLATASKQSYEESKKSFIKIVDETLTRWKDPSFLSSKVQAVR